MDGILETSASNHPYNRGPRRHLLRRPPLAGLAGIGSTLDRAVIKNAGNTFEVPQILIFSAIGGFISGIISLYVFAFALRLNSKWLGGAASREHLRAAIAWGALPLVAALLIWIPQIALFGKDAFLMDSPQAFSQPLAYWSLTAIEICAAVWALIAMAKTVGEVNQFSAWRALSALFLLQRCSWARCWRLFFPSFCCRANNSFKPRSLHGRGVVR